MDSMININIVDMDEKTMDERVVDIRFVNTYFAILMSKLALFCHK